MPDFLPYDPPSLLARHIPDNLLDRYHSLLMSENKRVNLVSRETTRQDFDRLVCESLLPLEVLGSCFDAYLDIGSGGGFPAVPLLLSRGAGVDSVLIERTGKRAVALERILTGLGLQADVEKRTFGEFHTGPTFDLITLRYVKLTPDLLARALGYLRPKGTFVYFSTPDFSCKMADVTAYKFRSPQDEITKSFTVLKKKRQAPGFFG